MKEFLSHAKYVIKQNKITSGAFVVFFIIVLIGIFGPMIAPYDPLATDTTKTFLPPCSEHWFGTDHVGRDIFSRILVATQLDLKIAVLAVIISIFFGTIVGCLAGYFGGWIDRIASRIVDTIMAFPLFVLAMGIVAALGNTVENIIYATAIINFPFYARVSRAEVNVRRNMEYIKAARISGNSEIRVIFAHILPNILPPMMVQVSLNLGWAILNAAGLSFIGLGVRPPTAEWGIMVAEGVTYIVSGEWWISLFPGLVLAFTVLTFNFLGDGLRDIIDPRERT
jgi:peptide/nickel transport system permease protein